MLHVTWLTSSIIWELRSILDHQNSVMRLMVVLSHSWGHFRKMRWAVRLKITKLVIFVILIKSMFKVKIPFFFGLWSLIKTLYDHYNNHIMTRTTPYVNLQIFFFLFGQQNMQTGSEKNRSTEQKSIRQILVSVLKRYVSKIIISNQENNWQIFLL